MTCSSAIATWGSTADERVAAYPCDGLFDGPHTVLFRGVDIHAPVELAFRWLCQMRLAPYSYDYIDNFGRRSPPHLIAGLEDLEVGQPFMSIFRLVSFEPGRSITLESDTALFGRVVITYLVTPIDPGWSRLVVKLLWAPRSGPYGFLLRQVLPAGDLIMMRKQLLTLKARAERDAALQVEATV